MSEGINYQVKYETPSGVESIDTARAIRNVFDGMTSVSWYPGAVMDTPTSRLVSLEPEVRHIPNERVIEINEL